MSEHDGSGNPTVPQQTESGNFVPMTAAEKLDAAQTRDEFMAVLTDLFAVLDKARLEDADE